MGSSATASENLSKHNRDTIRVAAAKAGVSNVSYKSKAENVEALLAKGVGSIDADGAPIYFSGYDTLEVPDEVIDDQAPSHGDLEAQEEVTDDVFDEGTSDRPQPSIPEPPVPVGNRAFNISTHADGRSVATWVADGELKSCDSSYGGYLHVVNALIRGEDPTVHIDRNAAVEAVLTTLGDSLVLAVEADGQSTLLYNGVEVSGKLADIIVRYHYEGRDAANLIKFLDRLMTNPVPRAITGLFDWNGFEGGHLAIDADGYFIGYKSVLPADDGPTPADPAERLYKSSSSGTATSDGVEYHGQIPQRVGSVVTMDPKVVRPGPECSTGLHVGSWDYASGFAGGNFVMEVRVDPGDVVNVPYDRGKMRVVKYEVAQIHDKRTGIADHHEPEATFNEAEVAERLEADGMPKTFWQRLFKRRERGGKAEMES